MITEITLKKLTSYKEENKILELKKLNFFYGNNGSGKSTIAKYLSHLTIEDDKRYLDTSHCSQVGFNKDNFELLVFDEKFVEKNFVESDKLKGIFSLDEKNEEIDRLIKSEQLKINSNEKYIKENIELILNQLLKSKSDDFYNLKKVVFRKRDAFKSFTKLNLPHSGNSSNHLNKIKTIIKENENNNISLSDLVKSYNSLYEKEIREINIVIPPKLYKEIRLLEEVINEKISQVIIGNQDVDIAEMIEEVGLKSWVEEGIGFLDDSKGKQKCPFCQEDTITDELLQKFENYFDETYKNKIIEISNLKNRYNDLSSDFIQKLNEIRVLFNPENILTSLISSVSVFFKQNMSVIDDKIENSNEIKEIQPLINFKNSFSEIIDLIKNHNENFQKLDERKEALNNDIWNYLAFNSVSEISDYDKKVYDYAVHFFDLKQIEKTLTNENKESLKIISDNRGKTVDTNQAKDEINVILKNSGITGFEIIEVSNDNISRYQIKRSDDNTNNQTVFKTLSEGEKNFIAFLYFYQLCIRVDDERNKEKKKVIVIDDPVSSLDSQVLFLVTTLIRELAKKRGKSSAEKKEFANLNIQQIFVLTHNTYFYKEVVFPIGNKLCQDVSYYQVKKINGSSNVELLDKNTIDNDYNLLWRSLLQLKNDENSANNVVIGNMMRRILQSYLNFTKNKKSDWAIIEQLNTNDPKRIIFSSLISQINDDSHESNPFDELHYQKITQSSNSDLFQVFEMIFKDIGGEEHYNAMLEV